MPDIAAVTRAIDRELPEIARAVIRGYLDMDNPANQRFLQAPDGREQHQTRWHEWGILTHTRVFLRHFDVDIPVYLEKWDISEPVEAVLQQRVDGASKRELMRIAILLHDIGKFAVRTRGPYRFHFSGHEAISGNIIRSELDLARFDLTPGQIEYIARTAEDHFVLALVRKWAKEVDGYDLAFTVSQAFAEVACDIKSRHPDDYVEVGVLFLGDSLAKSTPDAGPADSVAQYGLNIAVAHRYLQIVLGSGA